MMNLQILFFGKKNVFFHLEKHLIYNCADETSSLAGRHLGYSSRLNYFHRRLNLLKKNVHINLILHELMIQIHIYDT